MPLLGHYLNISYHTALLSKTPARCLFEKFQIQSSKKNAIFDIQRFLGRKIHLRRPSNNLSSHIVTGGIKVDHLC